MPSSLARRAALATSLVLAAAAPLSALGATHVATAPAAFKNFTVSNGANGVATGGEPTVGYDPKRNAVLFGAIGHETRMIFRDTKHGTSVQQTNVTAPTSKKTLDAITFTDKYTGRTFDDQLLGGCSAMAYTDDAGKNWSPATGCGGWSQGLPRRRRQELVAGAGLGRGRVPRPSERGRRPVPRARPAAPTVE